MKPPAVILLTAGVALLAHATLTALGMEVARVGATGSSARAELSVRGLFAGRFGRLVPLRRLRRAGGVAQSLFFRCTSSGSSSKSSGSGSAMSS